ncbi:MAG: class I SAM-dependent methyltransferase [Acidimicrobiia bacterium]
MPRRHWEDVYASVAPDAVGWFQLEPETSRRLIATHGGRSGGVVDVGGGSAFLVDRLLDDGWTDLTLVDIAAHALDRVRSRLGHHADGVTFVRADVSTWVPGRTFAVWHDRAVFHFLRDPEARERYVTIATEAVEPGGILVLGTFAPDGPDHCSGLPVCRYDATRLAECFGSAFALEHAEREVHVTPAGNEQAYTWVVLRRV